MRSSGILRVPASGRRLLCRVGMSIICSTLCVAPFYTSTARAAVVFGPQFRDVVTFATLDRVDGEDPFCSTSEATQELGVFEEMVDCRIGKDGHWARATASQISHLQPDILLAEGSIEASAEIDENASFAEGFGGSRLMSGFSVDATTEVRLTTDLLAGGNGTANLLFRVKNADLLVYRSIRSASDSIDEWLTLAPGAYELALTVGGFGQALPDGSGQPAVASFSTSVTFLNTADAGQEGLHAAYRSVPLILPNPMRDEARILPVLGSDLSLREIVIHDLAGRVVRRFHAVPAGGIVWDARDGEGRAVAAGIYVVRDSGGNSRKAMVLR